MTLSSFSSRSEREMVLRLTPEQGERLRPVDEHGPWTLPDCGTTGRGTRGGFCPCARCDKTRTRIEDSA